MAQSPAHRFGQIIGEVLEAAVEPILAKFAAEHELYLDKKGDRPARSGKKVTWEDVYSNSHDLDFVLERGGTPTVKGSPVAFIETAWRSYTKHSRNKAQEIQGAILPLADKHRLAAPFTGVVLAGMFTEGSLRQLESVGFAILFFSVNEVVAAFSREGIDARFGEDTPDAEMARKVIAWDRLGAMGRANIASALAACAPHKVASFIEKLRQSVTRQVERVLVLPLHGTARELASIAEAVEFVATYDDNGTQQPLAKYNIIIRFESGSRVEAEFVDRESAVAFLEMYTPVLRPVHLDANA